VSCVYRGPGPVEELAVRVGLDSAAVPRLLEVGGQAQLVKTIPLLDGDVACAPGILTPAIPGISLWSWI
jgi:hypothetical protein